MSKKSTAFGKDTQTANGAAGRIFVLDLAGGRVLTGNPDGSDFEDNVEEGRKLPDGLAVDIAARHLYWTNMGNPKANDGSILRSIWTGKPDHDRSTRQHIHAQTAPDRKEVRKALLVRREGMRVMRANLDGSNIETLVDTSERRSRPGPVRRKWCVGIAIDVERGKFYWTQKGVTTAEQGAHPAREHRHVVVRDTCGSPRHRNCCTRRCPSRSISISIPALACCIDRPRMTRRAATR